MCFRRCLAARNYLFFLSYYAIISLTPESSNHPVMFSLSCIIFHTMSEYLAHNPDLEFWKNPWSRETGGLKVDYLYFFCRRCSDRDKSWLISLKTYPGHGISFFILIHSLNRIVHDACSHYCLDNIRRIRRLNADIDKVAMKVWRIGKLPFLVWRTGK
mgnify:CR=1 FL=1